MDVYSLFRGVFVALMILVIVRLITVYETPDVDPHECGFVGATW